MDRLRDLARVWNWLPAFRAAAETEHLPSAAKHMLTSAPALSRSIRLLERNLGVALFRRAGRRLELAREGEMLLAAVRDAMRLVHETTSHWNVRSPTRPLRIVSNGAATTTLLAPGIAAMRAKDPRWIAVVTTIVTEEIRPALLRGVIDLALHYGPAPHDDLVSTPIALIQSSIYCGEGHPLYRRKRVTATQVIASEFTAPPPTADGTSIEGWPIEVPRKVVLHVDQVRVGMELCAKGEYLAVLPDMFVRSSALGAKFRRLPGPELPHLVLFATRRPPLIDASPIESLVSAIMQQAVALGVAVGGSREQGRARGG